MASSVVRSSKSSQKRPAPEEPQSQRLAKHRRTTRRASMEQRPLNAKKTLSQRWSSLAIDGYQLVYDSVSRFFLGREPSESPPVHVYESSEPSPSPSPLPKAKPLPPPPTRHPGEPPLTPRSYVKNLNQHKFHPALHVQVEPRFIPLPPSPPPPTERQSKRKSYNGDISEGVGYTQPRRMQIGTYIAASSSRSSRLNGTGSPAATSSNPSSSKRVRRTQESSASVEIVSSTLPAPPVPQDHSTLSNGDARSNGDVPHAFETTRPIPVRRYQNREHIYAKRHKQQVQETKLADRLEMEKELYNYERKGGYQSSLADFQSLLNYRAALEKLQLREKLSPSSSLTDLRELDTTSSRIRRYSTEAADGIYLLRALEKARATFNSPKPPKPFIPSWDQLQLRNRSTDEEIENRLRPKRPPLPTHLPPADDAKVDEILRKRGVISKVAREQVSHSDIARLLPSQWLNDEIINFYGAMIHARSDACKENPGNSGTKKPLKVHYFSTFFWPKVQEGYDKSRLAKWTKRFDIFGKDIILMAVNHNNLHWTSAAINFRKKRVEAYDSMGGNQNAVFKHLRAYIDAEHKNKKKKPFDFTGWENYSPKDTPQQENAFDCGVFTCTILEYLSRGEESFNFSQKHMPYFRRRMILEIGTGQLRDHP